MGKVEGLPLTRAADGATSPSRGEVESPERIFVQTLAFPAVNRLRLAKQMACQVFVARHLQSVCI